TGPLLLGHIFNSFLYGIELMQFSRYWTAFPDDKPWTRRLVYSVILLDTLQTGFTIHNAWRILGSGWGNQDIVLHPEWSWGSVPLFTGLVSLLVQGFYAYRISMLIQSRLTKWIIALILLISAAQCASGIFSGIYYAFGAFTGSGHTVAAVTTIWLGGTALCDLIITTAIVSFLMIKIAGFKPTDNVVSKVIKMTVETGALTTSFATADLILFLLFPATNLHLIFCIPLAKLYSNTLLAMLNARKGTFMQDTSGGEGSLPISIRQTEKRYSQSTGASVIDISANAKFQAPPVPALPMRTVRLEKPHHTKTTAVAGVSVPPLAKSAGHKRTESKQRLTDAFRFIDRGGRPSKEQANADFDSDLPSILDLSADRSFRTRFLNKFS
ncbi:hypothetical protein FRC19_001087, partial [Serendipita sp. 401]